MPDIKRSAHLLISGASRDANNGSLRTVSDIRGEAKALRARGGK